MKKSLILIGLLIGMNLISYSQEVSLTKNELENVLCKQWGFDYVMTNGMKIEQKPSAVDFDIKFNSNGEYELIAEDGEKDMGNWAYIQENKYVELSKEEKSVIRIKSINKEKLIMTIVSRTNDPPGLNNVEIHFKPI